VTETADEEALMTYTAILTPGEDGWKRHPETGAKSLVPRTARSASSGAVDLPSARHSTDPQALRVPITRAFGRAH